MRATSSTVFVRVNTGVTENAGMETRNSRKVTLENPKPTIVTEFNVKQKHMTYTYSIFYTSPPMSLCYTV